MKKHLKVLANILKDKDNKCPFGLPIPFGCQNAGEYINNMAPFSVMGKDVSEEEQEMLSGANVRLLAWNLLRTTEKPTPCRYAGHIFENKDAVACNYNDVAPGEPPSHPLIPAPYYSKMFGGVINGLSTYPIGYMSDYNASRNTYFGAYSIQGEEQNNILHKMALEILSKNKIYE
jgi:hypothetical protein